MAGSHAPARLGPGPLSSIQAGLCQASRELEHVASNGLSCFQKSKPPSKDNNIIKITSRLLRAVWLTRHSLPAPRGHVKECPSKDNMF